MYSCVLDGNKIYH